MQELIERYEAIIKSGNFDNSYMSRYKWEKSIRDKILEIETNYEQKIKSYERTK